jgi:predicted DNA-binding protein
MDMTKEKRHFSMRIASELYEKIQQYAERSGVTATAVVEESVRLALPKQLDKISCRIRKLKDGKKTRLICEVYVPSWSHTERWELSVHKPEVEDAAHVLSEKAREWVGNRLGLDDLEIVYED